MSVSSTSQVPSNNDDVECQENVISDKCNKYYIAWKRQRKRRLSSNNQSFTENSRDGKFTIGLIGEEGGYLELRNGDIQLYIPPGAKSDKGYVFMYADSVQYKLIKYDVIICGPSGQQFNNPVLLRFPKPKSQDDNNLLESNLVKLSVQELGKPLKWRSLDTTTDGSFFLKDGDILLHLNHFTGIKVDVGVQTSSTHIFFLTAFLEQQDQHCFLFRVFFSIYSALEFVNNDESKSNSRKIGNSIKMGSFLPEDKVTVKVIDCEGCQAKLVMKYMIRVGDIVSESNYISRQFVMESSSNVVESSSFKFQVGVGSEMVHIGRVRMVVGKKNEESEDGEPQFTSSPVNPPILTAETRRELSIELDNLVIVHRRGEPHPRPCDWRQLAVLMKEPPSYIYYLGSPKNCLAHSSPTIMLLNKWETDCRKRQLARKAALKALETLLNDLGNHACIKILERAINPIRVFPRFQHRNFLAVHHGSRELQLPDGRVRYRNNGCSVSI